MKKEEFGRDIVIVEPAGFLSAAIEAEKLSKIGINRGVFLIGQEALADHWLSAGSLAKVELTAAPHQDMPSPWTIQA